MRDDDMVYAKVTRTLQQALPDAFAKIEQFREILTAFEAGEDDLESFAHKLFIHRTYHENLYLDFPALKEIYSQAQSLLLASDVFSLRTFIQVKAFVWINNLYQEKIKTYVRADVSAEGREEKVQLEEYFRQETAFAQQQKLYPWSSLPLRSQRSWLKQMKVLGSDIRVRPLRAQRMPVERYPYTPFRFFTEEMALQRYADHCAAINQHQHNIIMFFDLLRRQDMTVPMFDIDNIAEQLKHFQQVHEDIHAQDKSFDILHEQYYQLSQSVAYVVTDALLKKYPQVSLGMNKHLFSCNCGHTHSDPQDSIIPMFYNYPASIDTVVIDAWSVVTFAMDSMKDLKEVGSDFLLRLLQGDGDFFVDQGFAWYTEDINKRISESDMSHFEQMMQ